MWDLLKKQLGKIPSEEEQLQGFLDGIGAGVVVIGSDYRILYMNDVARGWWQGGEGDYCYKILRRRRQPCPECPAEQALRENYLSQRSQQYYSCESWHTHDNLYLPIRDRQGKPLMVAMVSVNSEGRSHLKEEMLRDKTPTAGFLDSIEILVIGVSKNGKVILANKAIQELLGYTEGELKGLNSFSEIGPPDKRQTVTLYFEHKGEQGIPPVPVIIPLLAKSGEPRLISWTFTPLRGKRGEREGTIGFGQEVTQRVEAERESRERARIKALFESILAGARRRLVPGVVLGETLSGLVEVTDYLFAVVYIAEPPDVEFHLSGEESFISDPRPPDVLESWQEGRFPAMAREKDEVVAAGGGVVMEPRWREIEGSQKLERMYAVPFGLGERAKGLLVVGSEQTGVLQQKEEMTLLGDLADELGIALENAYLHQETEQALEESAALLEISRRISETPDPSAALSAVAEKAIELVDADYCAILLFDEETGKLEGRVRVGEGEEEETLLEYPLSYMGTVAKAARTLAPVISKDPQADKRIPREIVEKHNLSSQLVVPLVMGRRFIGAVILERCNESPPFEKHDATIISAFTGQASVAIENARLMHEVRLGEERYRTLLESVEEMVFLLGVDGIVKFVNPRSKEVLGYRPEEIVGKHYTELFPEEKERLEELFGRGLKGEGGGLLHFKGVTKDGREVTLEMTPSAVRSNGEITGFTGVCRDVTDRYRAREALQESEERYRALVESSNDAIVLVDGRGKILFISSSTEAMLGVDRKEAVGRNAFEFIPPDDRERVSCDFREAWEKNEPVRNYPIQIVAGEREILAEATAAYVEREGVERSVMMILRDITDRVKVQDALRESISFQEALFRAMPEVVLYVKGGEVVWCNQAAENIFGYSPKELAGIEISELHADEREWEEVSGELYRDLEGKGAYSWELEGKRKDGGTLYAEASASLINSGEAPESAEMVLVIRDVTGRKREEEALRDDARRFQDIAENALEWMWEVDADGKYTYASPVVERVLGYKPEEILEKHFYDLFHPEDREGLKKAAFEVFAQKKPIRELVNRNVRKDGQIVWLSTSGVPILDEEGELSGYRGADIDITDRKKAEQDLLRNATEYAVLFDAIPEMALILELDGKVVEVNRGLLRKLGYEEEEVVGKRIGEIETPEYAKSVSSRLRGIGYEVIVPYTVEYLTKGGSVVPVEVAARKIIYRGREAIFIVARDITERREAEQAIGASEERYRTLVESSHDAILLLNRDQEVLFANPAVEAVFGVTPEEIVGRNVVHYVHPDDRDRMAKDFTRDWLSGITLPNYRVRILSESGESIYVEATSGFAGDPESEAIQVMVLKDITELVQQERAGERRLSIEKAVARISGRFLEVEDTGKAIRATLEETANEVGADGAHLIYLAGDEGAQPQVYQWVGDERELEEAALYDLSDEWLNYCRDQLPGGNALAVNDIETLPKKIKGLLHKQGTNSLVIASLVVEGETKGHLAVQTTEVGREWHIDEVAMVQRVTGIVSRFLESARVGQRLAQSEKFRAALTDSMVEGIIVCRREGKEVVITWGNERLAEMSGYKLEELVGNSPEKLFARHEQYMEYGKELFPALKEKGTHVFEAAGRKEDGTLLDFRLTAASLGGGEDMELVATITDITEEKRMGEMVRAAAEAYSTLFTSSGDGLVVQTIDGKIREANERATELLQRSRDELIGMRSTDLVPKKLAKYYPDRVQEMRTQGISVFETPFVRPDGTTVDTEVTARITHIWDEEVILASMRDISARKQAEREAQKSAQQLAALNEVAWAAASALGVEEVLGRTLERAIDALGADVGSVFVVDEKNGEIRLAAQVGYGTETEEKLEDKSAVRVLAERALSSGQPLVISDLADKEERRKLSRKDYVYYEEERSGAVIPLKAGEKIIGTFGLGSKRPGAFGEMDIDFLSALGSHLGVALENAVVYERVAEEHRRVTLLQGIAREATRWSELDELLRAIVRETAEALSARGGLLALVEPGQDKFVWKAAYNLDMELIRGIELETSSGLGGMVVSSKGTVNTRRLKEIPADDSVREALGFENALLCPLISGERVLGVMGIHDKKSREGFTDEDEEVLAAIGRQAGAAIERASLYQETKRHLEELERAHEELKVLDKMKSDFVSTVSHELRSPLAVIEGFAKTLVAHFDELDRATERESLEIILSKSMALERLIENILDMSCIEEGRLEVRREKVDLGQICKQVCSEQARTSTAHRFRIAVPDSLPPVIADKEKVEVALVNLMGNAIKYSPGGGLITMVIAPNDREAKVMVKDEGIGIPPDQLGKIFDRFYQVESGETRAYPGSGLGLYITRELVEAMGGTIQVESKPGKGSTFIFTLPLAR